MTAELCAGSRWRHAAGGEEFLQFDFADSKLARSGDPRHRFGENSGASGINRRRRSLLTDRRAADEENRHGPSRRNRCASRWADDADATVGIDKFLIAPTAL